MPLPRSLLLLAFALLTTLDVRAADADANSERTNLAHLLAFGRRAASTAISSDSLAAQLEHFRADLQRDSAARERVAATAWRDAFGRVPSAVELQADAALPLTYTERLQRHAARLRADPGEHREVIRRAYALVVHRDAYAEEIAYWQPHGALPFVLLIACLEDWARRNQPGLMVTAGAPTIPAHSRFVTIVSVTPMLAAEARAVLARDANHANVSRILAMGAGSLTTPGGMHLAIVGRD